LRRPESYLAHRVDYSDAAFRQFGRAKWTSRSRSEQSCAYSPFGCRQRGVSTAAAFNSRVTDNILRVGVNYKFDPNEIWSIY